LKRVESPQFLVSQAQQPVNFLLLSWLERHGMMMTKDPSDFFLGHL
jgi:hypothetical protein